MPTPTSSAARLALGLATAAGLGIATAGTASAAPSWHAGSVYTSTNSPAGNRVEAFLRLADGSLVPNGTYATGGLGSGAGGSQGAVTLSANGRTLYVVDSGSDQVSVFAVAGDGRLRLRDVVASGGTDPTSVAVRGHLVEVLDAGSLEVAGFRASWHSLRPITGGSQPLGAGAAGPVDVTITPDGTHVVVTEKLSNTIDTFAVGAHGVLGQAVSNASDGPAAFASAYVGNELLVADAGGAGTSAVSPYVVTASGVTAATEPALPDSQSAACWIAADRQGYVFVANAGSASISTYRVLEGGQLAFLGNTQLAAGAKPLDLTTSPDGRDLYAIDETDSLVDSFAVGHGGSLTPVGVAQPVAAGALGLAAG